jgi:hypothetical protein
MRLLIVFFVLAALVAFTCGDKQGGNQSGYKSPNQSGYKSLNQSKIDVQVGDLGSGQGDAAVMSRSYNRSNRFRRYRPPSNQRDGARGGGQ